MGFIEGLKQQKEVEEAAKTQKTVLLQAQEALDAEARLKAEAAEKELHAKRRKEASGFRDETGIATLLESLNRLLPHSWNSYQGKSRSAVSVESKDEDSVFDKIWWDADSNPENIGENHLAVETSPEGTIIFHYGRRTKPKRFFGTKTMIVIDAYEVPLREWKTSKALLEETLEKAFHQPIPIIDRAPRYAPGPLDGKTIGNG